MAYASWTCKITDIQLPQPHSSTLAPWSPSLERRHCLETDIKGRESVTDIAYHVSWCFPSVRAENQIQKEKDELLSVKASEQLWDPVWAQAHRSASPEVWAAQRTRAVLSLRMPCAPGVQSPDARAGLPEFKSHLRQLVEAETKASVFASLCLCFPICKTGIRTAFCYDEKPALLSGYLGILW